ncbi:tyrosine-type recombinase/integrase [Actinopolymorpha alba]|uniref:tyrosine-type recombinase/integrase n=1 Tax=Actinopolymorpha alba TaxID=533267 RepID=UPI000379A9F8|nr:tyrosine-type recombinase/integrase [Actinopolymorpha alba]
MPATTPETTSVDVVDMHQAAPPAPITAEADAVLTELTGAWLATKRSDHTRAAYWRDLRSWLTWCTMHHVDRDVVPHPGPQLDPLTARVRDAELWGAWLVDEHQGGLSDASAARRMAAVSSWYAYLVKHEAVSANPFAGADRPSVDRNHSATTWLSETDARRLVEAADTAPGSARLRNAAMTRLMVELGIRVSEVVALPVTALGHQGGHRVIRVRGKGRKTIDRLLPAAVAAGLDAYLAERAETEGEDAVLEGPLFVTSTRRPVDRVDVARLVRRLAHAAGIPNADRVSPHSLRHTFATIAKQRGATSDELQEAMAHADRRTTDRYIRAAMRLERDPSQLVAAALG